MSHSIHGPAGNGSAGELVPRVPSPGHNPDRAIATELLGNYAQPVDFRERVDEKKISSLHQTAEHQGMEDQ